MSDPPPATGQQTLWQRLPYDAWLVVQLARRDVQSRYKGSRLGWMWMVITPLIMLGVYTVVFKYVFRVRWPGAGEGPVEFALQLFAGLLVFQTAAECWGRSSRLIVDHPHLVKKVRFPLALLPWAPTINALFHAAVSMLLLISAAAISGRPPQLEWLMLFPLLLPLGLLIWATSLLLASLGVFIRDLPQVVTLVIGLTQFLTPVFYPASILPPALQKLLGWNPLTAYIEQIRSIVFQGVTPGPTHWMQSCLVTALLIVIAYSLFRRVRAGFADVL